MPLLQNLLFLDPWLPLIVVLHQLFLVFTFVNLLYIIDVLLLHINVHSLLFFSSITKKIPITVDSTVMKWMLVENVVDLKLICWIKAHQFVHYSLLLRCIKMMSLFVVFEPLWEFIHSYKIKAATSVNDLTTDKKINIKIIIADRVNQHNCSPWLTVKIRPVCLIIIEWGQEFTWSYTDVHKKNRTGSLKMHLIVRSNKLIKPKR